MVFFSSSLYFFIKKLNNCGMDPGVVVRRGAAVFVRDDEALNRCAVLFVRLDDPCALNLQEPMNLSLQISELKA